LRPGATATADEVMEFCRANLAKYKVPSLIEFMPSLPKSAVGKVLRRELREMEAEKMK
ncbi:MAG: AMP-binding enzyme, partial [Blastocatellia bacterium]